MKLKKCWFVIGFCLLATRVFAGDPLVSFAQESLGLNLASIPFGQPAQTNNGYGVTSKPLKPQLTQQDLGDDSAVTWMTNSVSGKYHQAHADRLLRFAIRDGKIVGARVSINSFVSIQGLMAPPETIEQSRKELRQIETDLHKMREARKASLEAPAMFDLRTGFMCGPGESLFLMELQITPNGTLTAPAVTK